MRPVLLLDRDGTLIRDVDRQLWDPAAVELLPGVLPGLGRLRDAGWTFFMLTNQAGIAIGRYRLEDFQAVQARTLELLREGGITIEAYRFCPHLGLCHCRKPRPGMWESLRAEFPWINPAACVMVGDKDGDTGIGQAIGCRTARIPSRFPTKLTADMTIRDFDDLADRLLRA